MSQDAILGLALLVAGCDKSNLEKADPTELVAAFDAADPALKTPATAAAKAAKAGNLLECASSLAAVAKAGVEKEISEPQRNALINLGTSIQKVMSEQGDKADLKVYQAIEDMMAALTGRDASKVGVNPDAVRPRQPAPE